VCVVTFGVGAVAIGAAVCGLAAVGCTAYADAKNGQSRSVWAYAFNATAGSVTGAMAGAFLPGIASFTGSLAASMTGAAAIATTIGGNALLFLNMLSIANGSVSMGMGENALVRAIAGDDEEAYNKGNEIYNWSQIGLSLATIGYSVVGTRYLGRVEFESTKLNNNPNSKLQEVFDLADDYKLSDDVYNGHIVDRHGYSGTSYIKKSKFDAGFNIKNGIDSTLKGSVSFLKTNSSGRAGFIFERTYITPIGTDKNGSLLYTIKVVIDDYGNVITAFPVK
jgi:hypothetical protein